MLLAFLGSAKGSLFEITCYNFIILRSVRKCASSANLDSAVISDLVDRFPGTVLKMIQRTVTEETVDLLYSFMAWIVFAISVFKKSG